MGSQSAGTLKIAIKSTDCSPGVAAGAPFGKVMRHTFHTMRVHSFEHAPNEGAGKIADWARSRGHALTVTRFDLGETPPAPDAFDLLVVMGGAMNIYQHRDYPWLADEKRVINEAILAGKGIFGVCLGAQLLADALGARVTQNAVKEIGWWPVRFLDRQAPFDGFPAECFAFHWHGDTFSLPPGARPVAASDACANQAFAHGDRLVGLQFHIEVTPEAVAGFLVGADHELVPARFVQSADSIRSGAPDLAPTDAGLVHLLDALEENLAGEPT